MRNCTRDEGGPFGFGDQEPIPSHRELLRPKSVVVSVAETGRDSGRYGRERRAHANELRVSALRSRCRSSVGLNAVGSVGPAGFYGIFS